MVDVVADLPGLQPTPKSGELRADLIHSMRNLVAALRDTTLRRVLPALVADLAEDPGLRAHLLSTVFAPRRETSTAAIRSAVARGEIEQHIDLDFVLDAIARCAAAFDDERRGHWPGSRYSDTAQRFSPIEPL
ncbi:TetR-like C-terminal domain-containing protein [Nocardia brasiliensis]